jgi:hypothetical protein
MDLLQWERLNARLDAIEAAIEAGFGQLPGIAASIGAARTDIADERKFAMAAFDDLETKLTAAETRGDTAATLLATIHQELMDVLAAGATPARIQALADRVDADAARWQAAADANPDPNAPPPGP